MERIFVHRVAPRDRVMPLLGLSLVALLLWACGQKPTSIRVSPRKLTLYGLKKTAVLRADVLDGKGSVIPGTPLVWESATPKVASVEASGKVTSVGAGKTLLTIRAGELSETASVEVQEVGTITLSPTRMTLAGPKGTTARFSVTVTDPAGKPLDIKPRWSTADPGIATVDGAGVVTSVGEGQTGVSAFMGEPSQGKEVRIDVSGSADLRVVFREVAAFEVAPATVPLKIGDTSHLVVTARDPSGVPIDDIAVDWTSTDPRTATVSGGVVRGVAPGSTTVRGVCGRHSAEVSVLVF